MFRIQGFVTEKNSGGMENKQRRLSHGHPERGATMLEYALMAILIALVCIAAVTLLGQQASRSFSGSASGFQYKT